MVMYKLSDGVTQSILLDWMTCRRRAWWKLNGFKYPTSPSESLHFGNDFHWMVAEAREHPYPPSFPEMETKYWKENPRLGAELHTLEAIWDAYWDHHWDHEIKYATIASEEVFDVEYQGVRLRGKRDGRWLDNKDRVWIYECKTKSRFNTDTLKSMLEYDFQSLIYAMTWDLDSGEEKVYGVVYDIVRRPQLRLKKTESKPEYLQRVYDDINSRPEWYFQRFEIRITEEMRRQFGKELTCILIEYIAWWEEHEYMKENGCETACDSYRNCSACEGKFTCQYVKACGGDMSGLLKNQNPFKELE